MKLLNKDVILFPDGPLSVQVGEKSTQRRSQRVFDTRSGFRPPRAARQKARFGTNYLVVNAHGALILLERKVSEGRSGHTSQIFKRANSSRVASSITALSN